MSLVDAQLTDHFELSEFACGGTDCPCHGHGALVHRELVHALEEMRMAFGHPLAVNSGFRCDGHNATVHGHPRSFHRVGMAADVASWILSKDLKKWAVTFSEILIPRVGNEKGNVIWYVDRKFIHVDVGHRIAELVRMKKG